MKLKKYDKDRRIKIYFVVSIIICVVFVGLFVYQSYANYQMKATFKIMNGKLKMSGGSGDIEFAFYNGNQKVDDLPLKEAGVLYVGSRCSNDATIKWNDEEWTPTVYNLKKTKTNCTLYFGDEEDRACLFYPEGLACEYYKAGETGELLYDTTDDKNLRFVGSNPKNYVYFNCESGKGQSKETCETWRIIGIMNNVLDEKGNVGSHLKIIRDPFDTKLSWDSSLKGINSGYGVNEWSTSAIEKVLNNEYLNRTVGSNLCYRSSNNATETCPDWENIGIRDETRNMIVSVKWHTGTIDEVWSSSVYDNVEKFNADAVYKAEQSNHTGKEHCQESSGTYCNDEIDRTITWTGNIGLMSPSDYGYAIGKSVKDKCLSKSLNTYSSDNCRENDWLYDENNDQFTMIPVPYATYASTVFYVSSNGNVSYGGADRVRAIRPTLYLKGDVKIVERSYEDYGSIDHPFELSYE